jgi:hypothetical protein
MAYQDSLRTDKNSVGCRLLIKLPQSPEAMNKVVGDLTGPYVRTPSRPARGDVKMTLCLCLPGI